MADVLSVNLTFESDEPEDDFADRPDDNFRAVVQADVEFSESEMEGDLSYEVIAGLVEVDEDVDDIALGEITLRLGPGPYGLQSGSISIPALEQTARGAEDDLIGLWGVIGSEAIEPDQKRQSFTFKETIGSVYHLSGDDDHDHHTVNLRAGDRLYRSLYDEFPEDIDEDALNAPYDEDQPQLELRGLAWVYPEDYNLFGFAGDSQNLIIHRQA